MKGERSPAAGVLLPSPYRGTSIRGPMEDCATNYEKSDGRRVFFEMPVASEIALTCLSGTVVHRVIACFDTPRIMAIFVFVIPASRSL